MFDLLGLRRRRAGQETQVATPATDRDAGGLPSVLPPARYKWQSCRGCGTVQQIILASTKPTRCSRCGRSPFEV